ncbi:MAG: BlaI/MecI/CopY family transcriptional regulator [Candidatus Hydrogenedentes bacterium]|nr:BlaI/MecI/CopY family transcriptional regulator [Candidatus Hydrogenedentota bacterium]
MARRKTKTLTELELEIMQALWERGDATVEELADIFADHGKPLAPSSFRTMLSILKDKGYVTRKRAGRGFVYQARVAAEKARKSILSDLISRVFDGSATDLVAALVRDGMVSADDLAKARALIRQTEKGEKR